jgi:hypothetical protein
MRQLQLVYGGDFRRQQTHGKADRPALLRSIAAETTNIR